MRNRSRFTLVAAGLLLLAGAAGAQEPQQIRVDTSAAQVEATGVDIRDGAVLLTLEESVEIALRQNLGLSIQRYNRNRARLAVGQTMGVYDLLASVTGYAEDTNAPTISAFQSSESNSQRFDFSFDQLFPTGGQLTLGWANSRQENNNPFSRLNPGFNSGLEFRLNQPLMRGFGRLSTERELLAREAA